MESENSASGDNGMPLWGHVKMLDGPGPHCGASVWYLCGYCNCVFRGSYSTVKAHLLKISDHGVQSCPGVTVGILAQLWGEYHQKIQFQVTCLQKCPSQNVLLVFRAEKKRERERGIQL